MRASITIISTFLLLAGCASIPQESVELSQKIGLGITSIHETNIRFVNQYFEQKKKEIDVYQKEAINNFFQEVAADMKKKGIKTESIQTFFSFNSKIEKINDFADSSRAVLDASKDLVIEKLQNDYNTLIHANSSITGLLQSAVDIDQATSDGLTKAKELTGGKIDFAMIDKKVNEFLASVHSKSVKSTDLIMEIQSVINKDTGDQ